MLTDLKRDKRKGQNLATGKSKLEHCKNVSVYLFQEQNMFTTILIGEIQRTIGCLLSVPELASSFVTTTLSNKKGKTEMLSLEY